MSIEISLTEILNSLKIEEGFRGRAYRCSAGHLTIGYGRNIDESGLGVTEQEASYLLKNDVVRTVEELQRRYIWFDSIPKKQREVLVELCFQLGLSRLSQFKKMLQNFEEGNYYAAADELLDSKFAREQVPARADRLANKLRG